MRRKEYLHLLRHTDTIDESHEASTGYIDEGEFPASLCDEEAGYQREGGMNHARLFASPKIKLNSGDRLVRGTAIYRVVWAGNYPRHTEARIEEEDTPA